MLDLLKVGKPLSKEEQLTVKGGHHGCWFIVESPTVVTLICKRH